MQLRICTPSDCETLRTLGAKTYRETFGPTNTAADMDAYITTAFAAAAILQQLQSPHSVFVLAEDGAQPVGYMKVNEAPTQTELHDPEALEVERIYSVQSHLGQGVGAALLAWATTEAQRRGKKYLWLGVWEHNARALRFYEKNGFVRFGQHICRLGSDDQIDYLMRKDL